MKFWVLLYCRAALPGVREHGAPDYPTRHTLQSESSPEPPEQKAPENDDPNFGKVFSSVDSSDSLILKRGPNIKRPAGDLTECLSSRIRRGSTEHTPRAPFTPRSRRRLICLYSRINLDPFACELH